MELEDWKRTLLSLKHQVESRDECGCTQEELAEKLHRLLDEAKKHLGIRLQEIKASAGNTGAPGRIELMNQISELIDYIDNTDCDVR
jgi:hypothetical protein